MPTLALSNEQIFELFNQLPPEQKFMLLMRLFDETKNRVAETSNTAQSTLQQLAGERALDWDSMNDEDRIAFIDTLVHETR